MRLKGSEYQFQQTLAAVLTSEVARQAHTGMVALRSRPWCTLRNIMVTMKLFSSHDHHQTLID
jgi:hypothetical protein